MLKKGSTALPRFPRAGTPPPSPDAPRRNRAPCARRDGASPRDEAQATPAKARTPDARRSPTAQQRASGRFARRRTEPAHKIGGEERRIGGDSDDEATFRPVRLRPGKPSMDAGKRAHLASEAIREERQSKCPKRAGSSLALSTISVTCGRRRATTWASNGRLPSGSNALSPPPMRLDLPPASTMPIMPSGIACRDTMI